MPAAYGRDGLSRSGIEGVEMVVWCVLALLAALVQPPGERLPRLHNDSFQYLSTAQELRSGRGISTSLVHFDTERSHGVIPAPLTWFPPGYPAAIALLSAIGFGFENAALCISVASHVLVAAALWALLRMLEPSLWAARAAVLCWLANSNAIAVSAAVMSDAMFACLGMGCLLLLVNTDETGTAGRDRACWLGAGVVAGLSYWVRHAGVFWALACVVLAGLQVVAGGRRRLAPRTAMAVGALLLLLPAPLMMRNALLVGDWRGGNNTPVEVQAPNFALGTAQLLLHVTLGDSTVSQLRFPLAAVSAGLIWVCVAALLARLALRRPSAVAEAARNAMRTRQGIVLIVFLSYSIAVAAVSARSLIAYPPPPRYYVPVLPHAIALAACGIAFLIRRLPKGGHLRLVTQVAVVCLVAGYVAGNWTSRETVGPDVFDRTARALLSPDGTGRSMRQFLEGELKPRQVIAATNGQAAGYILQRPTLSLAGTPFTLVTWDESTLRSELTRFRAAHLLVFRDAGLDPVIRESQFLAALAEGQAPAWLRLAGMSRDICAYRVGPADTSHSP